MRKGMQLFRTMELALTKSVWAPCEDNEPERR